MINYKHIMIFSIVFLFYSYTPTYLGVSGYTVFDPINFIYLTILIIAVIFYFNLQIIRVLSLPISKWIIFYIVIILLWLLMPHSKATDQDIRQIILPIIFLLLMLMLTFLDDENMSISRKAILFATILAIINNIYEFFNPLAFYSIESGYNIFGRSAGFYINSNISGEAILIGLLLSYRYVYERLKLYFLLATFFGILVTFSRAGISLWFFVVFLLIVFKVIDRKKALSLLAIFFLVIGVLLPILISFIESNFTTVADNLITRLDFFSSQQHSLDPSELKRLSVASTAFDMFSNNPFFGSGISATRHWEFDVSTHNIYLKLMAEFGIIGAFLYPLILLSCIWGLSGNDKKTVYILTLYLFIIGFTTHNALDGYHILMTFAVLANLSYKSKMKLLRNR